MDRPDWVPVPAWARIAAVLAAQPLHAVDALEDLEAMTLCWSPASRLRLLEHVADRAESGHELPAAVVLALHDMMRDLP